MSEREKARRAAERLIVHNLLCRAVKVVKGHKGNMLVPIEDFPIGDPRCRCEGIGS